MPYSQFTTLSKAKTAFDLATIETERFLPEITPIAPSPTLSDYLAESLPLAASSSEKARSEGIIYPVLLEVRRILKRQVSLFSGEDFTVNESIGLNGIVDFLLSRSPELLILEAPVIVLVEAKEADLRTGLGQCAAEMVAARLFNEIEQTNISTIYGVVTSGTQWRFMKLEGQLLTIDLIDYPLPPVDQILGILVHLLKT
jgi:hypothetical protein